MPMPASNSANAKVTVKAPIEEVYQAVSDDALMQRWMAPHNSVVRSIRARPEPGGEFRVEMVNSKEQMSMNTGTYISVEPPNKIALTIVSEDPGKNPTENGLLTFSLRSLGDRETEVALAHSGISSRESADGFQRGWTECLEKLAKLFHESSD